MSQYLSSLPHAYEKIAKRENENKIHVYYLWRCSQVKIQSKSSYKPQKHVVVYDLRRHQDTISRRRRSPFARVDLSAFLYIFIMYFWPARV